MVGLSEVTFNIVFVRKTVRFLRPFLHSLRAKTRAVRFRIVSNGCTKAERAMLADWVEGSDRFELLEVSRARAMSHGRILDELFRRECAGTFAFMDSDCFVTGDPFARLVQPLRRNDAVFSGQPLWSRGLPRVLPAGYQLLADVYGELPDGTCTGGTYFALYDSRALSQCMRQTGVSFRDYYWRDLPAAVQTELRLANKQAGWYDVGKVLNVLLGLRGRRCRYVELPELWHVGALSSQVVERRRHLRRAAATLGMLEPLRRMLWSTRLRTNQLDGISELENQTRLEHSERREYVSRRVWTLLQQLETGQPALERLEHRDSALTRAVGTMENHLRVLHEECSRNDRLPAGATFA